MTHEQMTARITSVLSGLVVQNFRLVAGGALVLYVGGPPVAGQASTEPSRLWIESAWRLCADGRVIIGSLDDPDLVLPDLRKLPGTTIESVRLVGTPGDLLLTFSSGLIVESFTRSVHDEQWQWRQPDGLRLGLREGLEFYEAMETSDSDYSRLFPGRLNS